ncbi:MAG TPA: hypothetical protein VLR26_03975 [Frankiaceae bacterium]|nr:hypothetical protein [Frankiaceae bacterium]
MAGLLATTSALLQLLTRPVLGLADNGDYKRLVSPLHLVARLPPGQAPKQYLVLRYVPGVSGEQQYRSTELVFARLVHRVIIGLGLGPGMDVRALGVAHAVLLGVAVWLVVRALPGPLAPRAVTAVLLIVVVTDTRFVVYLNSFFTEPMSSLALLFLVAAVLHAWRAPTVSPWALVAASVAGLALVLDKSQHAPLALPIVAVLLARRCRWPRSGRWIGRLLPAVASVVLVVSAVGYVRSQPAHLDESNRYNAVFVEVLGHSANPAADLRSLGLDPRLVRYAGRPIYLPGNATKDPAFGDFFDRVTTRRIAVFYLEHPGRGLALAHRGATASMELIPAGVSPQLGTETRADSAEPVYDACKLCLFSTVSRGLRGASALLMPALWLAAAVTAWAVRRRPDRSTDGIAAVLLLLLSVAATAMLVALLGEGEFEIVKHLYLGSFGNALLAVFVVHAAGVLLAERLSRQ